MTDANDRHQASELAAQRFVRSAVGVLFLRNALALSAAWAFVWGTTVLVLRVAGQVDRLPLLWGLLGLVPAAIVAGVMAYRRRPKTEAVRALLDGRNRCGGLLMAGGEQPLGEWSGRVGAVTAPKLRWRQGRTVVIALAGAAFLLGSFLVPERFTTAAEATPLDISDDVQELAEQIAVLEEESIFEEQQATELKEKLEQVHRDATGKDPVKTWEALDHLGKQVSDAAKESVESAMRQTEQITEAQALAEALDQDGDQLSPDQFAEAMEALQQLVQQAAAESDLFSEALAMQFDGALANSALTPQQLKKLAESMQLTKEQLREMLSKLNEARLCDASKLAQCDKLGLYSTLSLCEGMGNCMNQKYSALNAFRMCYKPGNGGISRGRGDAPLTWNMLASSEDGVKYKEQVLPPGQLSALKDTQIVGLGVGAPQLETGAGPSTGGALTNASAGGGSAVNQTVLPRHRAAVQRYFDRTDTAGEPAAP